MLGYREREDCPLSYIIVPTIFWDSDYSPALKMKATNFFETLATLYQSTPLHGPEHNNYPTRLRVNEILYLCLIN
jgi:hypothetical protein